MTTPVPTFSGEVQFRRYSDTSTQGASIVLGLADRDDLSAFIGKEGRRFMCALVEVDDDEKPVDPKPEPKIGQIGYWLVMRCREPEFWAWIEDKTRTDGLMWGVKDEATAKLWVCNYLGIESRKEVDGNPKLERFFHEAIRGPYSRWLLSRGVTA